MKVISLSKLPENPFGTFAQNVQFRVFYQRQKNKNSKRNIKGEGHLFLIRLVWWWTNLYQDSTVMSNSWFAQIINTHENCLPDCSVPVVFTRTHLCELICSGDKFLLDLYNTIHEFADLSSAGHHFTAKKFTDKEQKSTSVSHVPLDVEDKNMNG